MLDLLLAASDAANTPERRMMLDGIMEGQDRELQRALESGADHGELLADDFFWCFMGLAMAHGDRSAWRTLEDFGYSLQSKVRAPDAETSDRGMALGCWGAAFLPTDRLDWLQKRGLLNPWNTLHRVGKDGVLNAAELGMLNGSAELFDYWLPLWAAHLHAERKQQRRTEDGGFGLPIVLAVLIGMEKLQTQAAPIQPFPSKGLEGPEIVRRMDGVLEGFLQAHYPGAASYQRLERMSMRPPRAPAVERLTTVARWQVAQEKQPFSTSCEHTAVNEGHFEWLHALLEAGAPVARSGAHPSLAERLSQALVKAGSGSKKAVAASEVFLCRARREDPAAAAAFFSPTAPSAAQPPVFLAIENRDWALVRYFLDQGCPLDLPDQSATPVGQRLLEAACADLNSDAPRVWEHWAALTKVRLPATLTDLWNKPAQDDKKPTSGRSPLADFPEFLALREHCDSFLTALIEHGCPINRRDRQGQSLGWAILRGVAAHGLDTKLWNAFRQRLEDENDTQLPAAYTERTAQAISAEFRGNPDLAMAVLEAAILDAAWPATAAVRSKPRM